MFFMKIFFDDPNENVNRLLTCNPLANINNIIFKTNISYLQ